MANEVDIKYLNKDFNTFKADLIEYAKAYFPSAYTDFSQASPGTIFIDMASYVGDVLSFYLDNQIQETFVQYAKQKNNLYALAYTLGYKPKVTSAAIANLEVYQVVPSKTINGLKYPDFDYALVIKEGMTVQSNADPGINFYIPSKVDFRMSSSLDDTIINIYQVDFEGAPTSYILTKNTTAISGKEKTETFTFGRAQRFSTITINDTDIIAVTDITDSNGNRWYEVPYLAQDYLYVPVANTAQNYPDLYQYYNQVPYVLEKMNVDRRFTTRFTSNESMIIEFGAGVNTVSDNFIVPNPASVGVGLTSGSTSFNTAYDPTNFLTTNTYGIAPSNTTLTVKYLTGGGSSYNVNSNELTIPTAFEVVGDRTDFSNTIACNNPDPAAGGGDGDTVEELRLNIQNEFSSQMRAVTQQDYLVKALGMPAKYGKVSKCYVSKDEATFVNYSIDFSGKDTSLLSMYVLGLDSNGNLAFPTPALLRNLQTYLSEYRMMTDSINLKSGFIINIGCDFDIVVRPNYNSQDVIARCIIELKDFFNISNWQINEPIIISDIYTLLDLVEGVQTVRSVKINNKYGAENGYSPYSYDIPGATVNGIIYPSLDPSIFEVKYPDSDIEGRVVSF